MELQRDLEGFTRSGIRAYAISPDPVEILRKFAEKYSITYPLLSDAGSRVIRAFGLLNTHMSEDHEWFGVPYPGSYMLGADGRVFDKSFIANHGIRRAVSDILQESFRVSDREHGEVHTVKTDHLTARAWFPSPTVRRAQRTTLTVEIDLAEKLHIYGRPLPEGYIPVELSLADDEDVLLEDVSYPEAEPITFAALGETLPAYHDSLTIKAQCRAANADKEEPVSVRAILRYQACDEAQCYLPQTITFELPLKFLPHDWERLD